MGYRFDFSLVRLPTFDADGVPVQQRGVTNYAGLYFVGMPWLPEQKTGLLLGVGQAAEHSAAHIARGEQAMTIARSVWSTAGAIEHDLFAGLHQQIERESL